MGFDSDMMCKMFGTKWKQIAKRLIDHSLIHCREIGSSRYYTVHPYIIILIESEITNDEKLKLHEKICEEFSKRIEKISRHIGTLSESSQRAQ
jgi:DNA phosphorothioation-dependent restriction protein DptG